MLKPPCSNFRIIATIISGVQIFISFTVFTKMPLVCFQICTELGRIRRGHQVRWGISSGYCPGMTPREMIYIMYLLTLKVSLNSGIILA